MPVVPEPAAVAQAEASDGLAYSMRYPMEASKQSVTRQKEHEQDLARENMELQMLVEQHKNNLKDINEFLTNELQAQALVGLVLNDRVATLEKELVRIQETNQAAAEQARQERDNESAQRNALSQEAKDMQKMTMDLRQEKTAYEAELSDIKSRSDHERMALQRQLRDMERSRWKERKEWQREAAALAESLAAHLPSGKGITALEASTRQLVMENAMMAAELRYQSLQATKITHRSSNVTARMETLQHNLKATHATGTDLAMKNIALQRQVTAVAKELAQQQSENQAQDEAFSRLQEHIKAAEEGKASSVSLNASLLRELAAAQRSLLASKGETTALRKDLHMLVTLLQQNAPYAASPAPARGSALPALPAVDALRSGHETAAARPAGGSDVRLCMTGELAAVLSRHSAASPDSGTDSFSADLTVPLSDAAPVCAACAHSQPSMRSVGTQTLVGTLSKLHDLLTGVRTDGVPWGKQLSLACNGRPQVPLAATKGMRLLTAVR